MLVVFQYFYVTNYMSLVNNNLKQYVYVRNLMSLVNPWSGITLIDGKQRDDEQKNCSAVLCTLNSAALCTLYSAVLWIYSAEQLLCALCKRQNLWQGGLALLFCTSAVLFCMSNPAEQSVLYTTRWNQQTSSSKSSRGDSLCWRFIDCCFGCQKFWKRKILCNELLLEINRSKV